MHLKYWEADSISHIFKRLDVLRYSHEQILLWQNQSKRRLWDFSLAGIDPVKKTINAIIKEIDHAEEIIPGQQVFIALPDSKNIFFKTYPLKSRGNKIILTFPELIKCVDEREIPRFEIDFEDNRRTIMTKSNIYGSNEKSINLRILDISKSGMAVCFGAPMLTKLKVQDNISINEIAGVLSPKLEGKVKYIRPLEKVVDKTSSKQFRCGIEFDKSISESLMNQIYKE